jgi:hypothetical protein
VVEDPLCNCVINLPDIDPATGWTFTIDPTGVLAMAVDQVNISLTSGDCPTPMIVINDGTPTASIAFPASPCAALTSGPIEFTVTAAINDPPTDDCVTYRVNYASVRDPVKIVLVLDISGSMWGDVYSTSPTPLSRWQVLNNAVNSFLTKVEEYDADSDLVGLTYFTTDIVPSNAPLGDNMISSVGSQSQVQTDLTGRDPLNLTAMGKGLSKGKQIIGGNTDDDHKKVIVLFTDGLQNVAPLAQTVDIGGGETVTFLGPQADDIRLNDAGPLTSADSIYYYCVAMDYGPGTPTLLQQLAAANGGDHMNTYNGLEAEDAQLMTFYDNILTAIFNGGSPQIVAYKNGQLENGVQNFEFDINDHISQILFELNFAPGDSLMFTKIEKDGIDLTSAFSFHKIPNGNYIIRSLKLPYDEAETDFSVKGKWKVIVSGTSSNPFKLKCFVDDHKFEYACSTNKHSYIVGDTITFNSRLSYAGNKLSNKDNKVKVLLVKPGDDIGHLMAVYATPDFQPDSLGDKSAVSHKLNELLKDESFLGALTADDRLVELEQDENGNFTGIYTDTELSGVYQAVWLIEAEDKYMGKFIRTTVQTIVFNFGVLDPDETDLDIDVSQVNNTQTFVITLKPKNKFGYFLGPGFSSFLKLNLDTIRGVKTEIVDNLDGSYTYTISDLPADISPNDVCFTIFNEQIGCESYCHPVTIWYYIILLVILLVIILIKKIKANWFKIIMWIIFIVWLVYIVLRYLKIICYEFL